MIIDIVCIVCRRRFDHANFRHNICRDWLKTINVRVVGFFFFSPFAAIRLVVFVCDSNDEWIDEFSVCSRDTYTLCLPFTATFAYSLTSHADLRRARLFIYSHISEQQPAIDAHQSWRVGERFFELRCVNVYTFIRRFAVDESSSKSSPSCWWSCWSFFFATTPPGFVCLVFDVWCLCLCFVPTALTIVSVGRGDVMRWDGASCASCAYWLAQNCQRWNQLADDRYWSANTAHIVWPLCVYSVCDGSVSNPVVAFFGWGKR